MGDSPYSQPAVVAGPGHLAHPGETDDGAHDSSVRGLNLHIGWLFLNKRRQLDSKLPLASTSHFAFHPERPAQSHWGAVMALPAEPGDGEGAEPGSRLGAVISGLCLEERGVYSSLRGGCRGEQALSALSPLLEVASCCMP